MDIELTIDMNMHKLTPELTRERASWAQLDLQNSVVLLRQAQLALAQSRVAGAWSGELRRCEKMVCHRLDNVWRAQERASALELVAQMKMNP